jgi:predicted CXXCH cytochrome family protein
VKAVSQVEQLAQSRCASRSGGKLWCGTCHNPHSPSADRSLQVRDICRSCHTALSAAAHLANLRECGSCHMPRLSTEYAHVAVTDHRIVRRANPATEVPSPAPQALAAWVEPPAALRKRNLVLAECTAGVRQKRKEMTEAGLEHLRDLAATSYQDDPVLQAAACDALVQEGKIREGLAFCRQAAARQPQSADRAMALGSALARANDFPEAERHLARAIQLDPSLKHAYVELWTLYDRQQKTAQMKDIMNRYLTWNPRNIMFRILKSDLAAGIP